MSLSKFLQYTHRCAAPACCTKITTRITHPGPYALASGKHSHQACNGPARPMLYVDRSASSGFTGASETSRDAIAIQSHPLMLLSILAAGYKVGYLPDNFAKAGPIPRDVPMPVFGAVTSQVSGPLMLPARCAMSVCVAHCAVGGGQWAMNFLHALHITAARASAMQWGRWQACVGVVAAVVGGSDTCRDMNLCMCMSMSMSIYVRVRMNRGLLGVRT